MGRFKHPCLVHGTVHTPFGAFTIVRGVVDLPDEVGEAMGWQLLSEEHALSAAETANASLTETHESTTLQSVRLRASRR